MKKITKFHKQDVINSMDFSDDGRLLITACDDDSIVCYNTETASYV